MFKILMIWWNSIIPCLLGVTHGYDFIIPGIIGLIFSLILYIIFTYKKEPPIKSIVNTFYKMLNYNLKPNKTSIAMWKMD